LSTTTPAKLFLQALCREGSRTGLRSINPEWLDSEELPMYQFVSDHVRRYGNMPTEEALRDNGYRAGNPRENSAYYADRLRQRAIFNAFTDNMPALLDALENRQPDAAFELLGHIQHNARAAQNHNVMSTLAEEMARLEERFEDQIHNQGLLGVTTGFPALDHATQGLLPGDTMAVVGRPSVGKSYKLFKMAHAAWHAGYSVMIPTMEMSVEQCVTRWAGMESKINPQHIRSGRVSTMARGALYGAIDRTEGMAPVHFMAGNVRKTIADIDMMIQELNPDVVYIDAGYLLAPERDRRRSGRREYIADVMEEMKGVASDRHKPIVTSVQFNREVKKGSKKELDLSMIGETDVIAQIMALIVGIRHGEGTNVYERRCDLMKNREGELTKYRMHFRHSPMNFEQITGEEDAAERRYQQQLEDYGAEEDEDDADERDEDTLADREDI